MERTTTRSPILALALVALIPAMASAQQISVPAMPGARADMGIRFIPNMGQIVDTDGRPRPEIRYSAHFNGMDLYLSNDRISYVFTRVEGDLEHHRHADGNHDAEHPEPILHSYRMDMEFLGASPEVEILTEDRSSPYMNFYLPHVPQGIPAVRSVGSVIYRNIYPNVDFVIYGSATGDSGSALKYNFVVRPGGSAYKINLTYRGATSQSIDEDARLVTETPYATLIEDTPYCYQQYLSASTAVGATALAMSIEKPPYSYRRYLSSGSTSDTARRWTVSSGYMSMGGIVRFNISRYDRTQTLVIEPALRWSTFYGGNGSEDLNGGHVSDVDRSGNVLVTGGVNNANFPVTTGSHYQQSFAGITDIFIVKMNSRGELLWATIYGGSQQELAHGIVTDSERSVFIAGHTFSNNFPTDNSHQASFGGTRDAFAVKFDSNGVRQWGTYYGGSGFDDSYGFAVDSTGNPAMVLTTGSSSAIATTDSFDPTYNGTGANNYDAAIVKFDGDGVVLWATYVGGTGLEYGYGGAADIGGNINITGWTNSSNFPVTAGTHQSTIGGGYDAFVMRFDRDGQRQWGTFYGGTGTENDDPGFGIGYAAIATDGDGNPIITGQTASSSKIANSLQTTYGGSTDAYVAKFDNQGRRLWSTYLGGTGLDVGQGIATGDGNSVLVTGHTSSVSFPVSADAFQRTHAGGTDAFVVTIDGAGRRMLYGTYLGGPGNDAGIGIGADASGRFVVAGTASAGFPVTAGAHQTTLGGGSGNVVDVFIASFCYIGSTALDTIGSTTLCEGDSVTLVAPSGYSSYLWQSPTDSAISVSDRITLRDTGVYWVRVTSEAGCSGYSDTIEVIACQISGLAIGDAVGSTRLNRLHPNPTGGLTSIEYEVAASGRTQLLLVDMLGRRMSIVDAMIPAGRHIATFDASMLPAGLYFCILESGSLRITQSVTIVR